MLSSIIPYVRVVTQISYGGATIYIPQIRSFGIWWSVKFVDGKKTFCLTEAEAWTVIHKKIKDKLGDEILEK